MLRAYGLVASVDVGVWGYVAIEEGSVSKQSNSRGLWVAAAIALFIVASLAAWWQPPNLRLGNRELIETLLYPIERNPADRLPAIRSDLSSVSMADNGQHAVAVGENGAVFTSSDGGQSWAVQASGLSAWIYEVAVSANGRRAIALAADNTILISGNGGQSWSRRAAATDSRLASLDLSADGQHALAVGENGAVFTSSDGGQNWQTEASGTSARLEDVAMSADGRQAVVIGGDNTIITSNDGGQKWQAKRVDPPMSDRVASVQLLSVGISADGQRAVAVGNGGTIFTSDDRGQSWSQQVSGTGETLVDVALSADGQYAVAVGIQRSILASNDGGKSWAVSSRGGSSLRAIASSANGQRAVVVGYAGEIITSSDGGRSWAARTSDVETRPHRLTMSSDGERVLAVGWNSDLFTSTNGGKTWAAPRNSVGKPFWDISVSADGQKTVALGDEGTIFASSDGGQSWTVKRSGLISLPNGLSVGLVDIALSADGRSVVAVGNQGTILVSSDGGQSWSVQINVTRGNFTEIALSGDGRRALAFDSQGAIFASSDGGQRWTAQHAGYNGPGTLVPALDAFDLAMSFNGDRALALGLDGVIFSSSNGGRSWAKQAKATDSVLRDIALSADGRAAVAVGDQGTVLVSSDGGQSWSIQTSGANENLVDVAVSADGQRAVAVGSAGSFFRSSDRGKSWEQSTSPRHSDYSRLPAPWYLAAFILSGFLLYRGLAAKPNPPQSGAAAIAASDAPAFALEQDKLGFAPLARGISRFLRNANTSPPLTLAITGEWGSGKSSLMGQVCADLKAHGWRPVWFNAWHHQNEEQLLAALLVAVRENGVPPVASLSGALFRLRLLLTRAEKNKFGSFALVSILVLTVSYIIGHLNANEWEGPFLALKAIGRGEWTEAASSVPLASGFGVFPILGLLFLLSVALREMKAFGVDPAVLLASTVSKFRLKDAIAQTSFRMRFAEQFGEVTTALRHPMVIVIDDLDRCKAETVLDVMEAVNFLTSSGRCFVIFGMASERVQAALALSFKDVASELVEIVGNIHDLDVSDNVKIRQRRLEYARQYLDKLVNIEVKVPDRSDIPAAQLLEPRSPLLMNHANSILAFFRRWAFWGFMLLAILLSAALSQFLPAPWKSSSPRDKVMVEQGPSAEAVLKIVPQPKRPVVQSGTESSISAGPMIVAGRDRPVSPLWFIASLVVLAGWGGVLFLVQLSRRMQVVQDSAAFKDALYAWLPVAAFRQSSPRSIKRFGNRIRYLAMLQQGEQLDDMPMSAKIIETLTQKLAFWGSKLNGRQAKGRADNSGMKGAVEQPRALSEHRVVALGAMHAHFGDADWRFAVGNENVTDWADQLSSAPTRFGNLLKKAIQNYRSIPGASWPPSEEELDAFQRSLNGVRLPGEARSFDAALDVKVKRPGFSGGS